MFAVGQEQGRHLAEQPVQHLGIVHQHVAGGGPHEHLDPGHLRGVQGGDEVEVVVADPEVKAIVGHRNARCAALLVVQGGKIQGRRRGVGHVHEAGDATGHRRPRLAVQAALVRRAGVAKVHLVVDHARQQPLAAGVDFDLGAEVVQAADGVDASVRHQHVGVEFAPFVHQAGVADENSAHAQNSFCRAL